MSNATISTFIIDLKLTPEGQVRILEFGRAWNYSGFTGHDAHSPAKALTDKIGGFYKSFGVPVVQVGTVDDKNFPAVTKHIVTNESLQSTRPERAYAALRKSMGGSLEKKSSDPRTIADHSMIVLPDHIFLAATGNLVKRFDEEGYSSLIVDRKPGPLYGCMVNKALLHMLVGQHAPEIFPQSEIIVYRGTKQNWQHINSDQRRWSNGAVLKIPTAIRGEGVCILPPGRSLERDARAAATDLAEVEKHVMLVAQPVIHGRRVKHPENGRDYDPTIRVAVSAVNSAGRLSLAWHDIAYNKFPAKPAASKTDPEALKSVSEGVSSLVSEFEKASILRQLQDHLTPALARLYDEPINLITEALKRHDPLTPYMALAFLENCNYTDPAFLGAVCERHPNLLTHITAELA